MARGLARDGGGLSGSGVGVGGGKRGFAVSLPGVDVLTVGVLRSWARTALAELGRARVEIDELNVYPVPDGDTGTNLYLTWEAACDALPEGELTFAEAVQAFGRGALLGARGNSGVIASQLVRACGLRLAENLPRRQASEPKSVLADPRMSEAAAFADALVFAADAAYGAVAEPVEGTMLTVAREAANAALKAANNGQSLPEVCLAAVAAARVALIKTTEQLEPLRRAGVVDAGGAGLVVILGAMESVLSGRAPAGTTGVPARIQPETEVGNDLDADGPAYEVMYLLDAPDEKIGDFRQQLARLGDSVVVVGGDGLWNVHVHTDDVGGAIEEGIGIGRPYRIRVTHFADLVPHPPIPGRAVIAVAAGDGLAGLFADAGAIVVRGWSWATVFDR